MGINNYRLGPLVFLTWQRSLPFDALTNDRGAAHQRHADPDRNRRKLSAGRGHDSLHTQNSENEKPFTTAKENRVMHGPIWSCRGTPASANVWFDQRFVAPVATSQGITGNHCCERVHSSTKWIACAQFTSLTLVSSASHFCHLLNMQTGILISSMKMARVCGRPIKGRRLDCAMVTAPQKTRFPAKYEACPRIFLLFAITVFHTDQQVL